MTFGPVHLSYNPYFIDMVIWSVKDLQSVQTKLFSFYMCFGFSYLSLVSYFFLNCSLAAVSIQVCTAKMNLCDEVDLKIMFADRIRSVLLM